MIRNVMNQSPAKVIAPTLVALLLLAGPAGCGGAIQSYRPDPIPADRARELDALEGQLGEAQQTLDTLDPLACPDRCRSVESICDASERICEIASELGEDAVTARCTRASRSCDEARESTSSCGCAAPATGEIAMGERRATS